VEDLVSYDAWKLASPPGYDHEPDCPACDDAGCPQCCETSPMTEDDLIEIITEEEYQTYEKQTKQTRALQKPNTNI
jgi:hypothetical protein